jgi:hypothetical protein
MKGVISLAVLWVLSLCPSAGHAQTSNLSVLAVKIPFEFVVGNRIFPAGSYKFQSLLNSVAGKDTIDVLTVRSAEGRLYQAIVTEVADGTEPTQPRLLFTHRGGRAFLAEVWEPGKRAGCRIHNRKDQTETAPNSDDPVTLLASADWR